MTLVFAIPVAILAAAAAIAYGISRLEPGSGDRLRQRQAASPLAHELPWWHVDEDGVIVGVDLTYSIGLELAGVDTDCLSSEALEQVQRGLHSMLHVLPPGTKLQLSHTTDTNHTSILKGYRGQVASMVDLADELVAAKVSAITRAASLRRSRLHLFCSVPNRFQGAMAKAGFAKKFVDITPGQHEDERRRVLSLREQLARGLGAAGVRARALDGAEARGLIYEALNPTRSQFVPAPSPHDPLPFTEEQTLREQLSFSAVREEARHLELDGRLLRVLSLLRLPEQTSDAMLECLTVALGFPCRVVVSVEMLDDRKVMDQLKRKRNRAAELAMMSTRRNPEAEAQHRDVEELIDQSLYSSIRVARLALAVVLSADARLPDPGEVLDAQAAEVLRLLSTLEGAEGLVEEYAQLDSWLATLPASGKGHRWHTCTSENTAHLLPAWQSWPGHESPAVLFENARNYLCGLDPFSASLDNPNAFMAGSSGGGKSVTTNYLLMHLLAGGAKALVIDVGGSYRKLIDLFGGDYLTFDRESDPALNLFYDPADIVLEDGSLDPLRLHFILTVLESLLVEHSRPQLSNEEQGVLNAAIHGLYAQAAVAPLLSDLAKVLRSASFGDPEDELVARQLARRLRYWLEGPHARLLNRPSTIRLTSDFAAFDLKGLSENVRGPVVLILSAIIWNLVTRDPSEKKIVVFDEVWSLLEGKSSGQLLEELYRTSRKYRCAILAISQSVEDFTKSSIAPALVQNSATNYLLRHRAGHEVIAEHFHLNEREAGQFEGLEMRRGEYSEIMVLAGREHHFVARVVLTPLEYWIATTHPADRAALDGLRAEMPHLTLLDALRLAAERWPQGAAESFARQAPATSEAA